MIQAAKGRSILGYQVRQQIIVQARVVSNLRFIALYRDIWKASGRGQNVDFVATDMLGIDQQGQIIENWYVEDNLTSLKQIGAVS